MYNPASTLKAVIIDPMVVNNVPFFKSKFLS